jgi:hypothetical protein
MFRCVKTGLSIYFRVVICLSVIWNYKKYDILAVYYFGSYLHIVLDLMAIYFFFMIFLVSSGSLNKL